MRCSLAERALFLSELHHIKEKIAWSTSFSFTVDFEPMLCPTKANLRKVRLYFSFMLFI